MIFRLKQAIGACILASALLPTATIQAETYYVATTGNDSNPGTENQPFLTIAHAVDSMVAGDTTYVKEGTYNEGIIRFKRSGTQTAPIKLLNYPNQSPTIHFIDPNSYHKILIQNEKGYKNAMGWITIEGFELTNGWEGIKAYNLHDSIIRRNWIHGSNNLGRPGILGNGTRILIDRNVINDNGIVNVGHGIYMNGTAITITNNLIYDNGHYGIQMNGSPSSYYDPTKHAGPEFAVSENWVIANNTFAYQKGKSGITVWGSTCNNARIENNIFYENAVASSAHANGIAFVGTSCTGIRIRNNYAYASGSGGTAFLSKGAIEGVHYMQSGNIVNTLDPGFVHAPATLPASPDFKLNEGSPVIDKGLPLTFIQTAFDGTKRPQGRAYDVGAYEYSTNDESQLPKAPVALQVH